MDEQMHELMADDLLRRRLEAYAGARLSPDLSASSRLRARVMAVAHRHASLARADAALTLLPPPGVGRVRGPADDLGVAARAARQASRIGHGRSRRSAGVVLAASLAAVIVVGGVYAARPGGPMYETRLWAETLALPGEPSARALAELDRLQERLREIGEASRTGDGAGMVAALAAYATIVEEASASAILADDDIAAAVLESGVGRSVEVLRALAANVPATAGVAITRAVDAAIARSADAVARIGASRPGGGGSDDGGTVPASPPRATKTPTAQPTPAEATPKQKPTRKPTSEPTATPEPTPEPDKTPDRTAKPKVNQSQTEGTTTTVPQPGDDEGD